MTLFHARSNKRPKSRKESNLAKRYDKPLALIDVNSYICFLREFIAGLNDRFLLKEYILIQDSKNYE